MLKLRFTSLHQERKAGLMHPYLELNLMQVNEQIKLNPLLLPQSSEGRDYLLSLENMAAWVAERVLPFLAKSTTDDGQDSEKPLPLAAQITEVSSAINNVNTLRKPAYTLRPPVFSSRF